MNHQFDALPEYKQLQQMQSFYEPALRILNELIERNKANLRKRGYNEANAALARDEFEAQMSRRFRITMYLSAQIESSLMSAGKVKYFGGYIQPADAAGHPEEKVKP
ncbi:hypothetical protein ACE5JW_00055 [Acinetobacter radioresistens]|jgi:hypothetical protein|nr:MULTISPECIES: hypothetical protein [Acinetobacter]EEY86875.1 hypothetical protein HMPREF0018_01448 [Acinetobacter radioresistens SH164]ENV84585.1 hypothetical protein F940_02605 [Acinetobacter radioresistens NIPH 2130]EXB79189.1 hypothetical protein J538_3162 [Acinetobacter sp. 272263]MCK4076758.1 hypothetical protein [Acinetobacter radioresistens]MCK4083218.1 hypothetical protein [Acinetobacter radioresistens]